MAAATITPLDSGICLVIILNVPAVVSLLLFIFFFYEYFNGKLGEGGCVSLNLKIGNIKTIPWRCKLCWKNRTSHISLEQSDPGANASGLQNRKSSQRQGRVTGWGRVKLY